MHSVSVKLCPRPARPQQTAAQLSACVRCSLQFPDPVLEEDPEDEALRPAKYINALGTGTTIAQGSMVYVGDHEILPHYIENSGPK